MRRLFLAVLAGRQRPKPRWTIVPVGVRLPAGEYWVGVSREPKREETE